MSAKRSVFIYINIKQDAFKSMNFNAASTEKSVPPISCPFPHASQEKHYFCYDSEICCDHGCCGKLAKQFYQHWYYWAGLIFALFLMSTLRYIYKRAKYKKQLLRIERERIENCPIFHNMCHSNYILTPPSFGHRLPILAQNVPRVFGSLSNESVEDDDVILNHFFASFRNNLTASTTTNDPPSYINPPDYESLSIKQTFAEPPPKYSDTYIKEEQADNNDCSNSERNEQNNVSCASNNPTSGDKTTNPPK